MAASRDEVIAACELLKDYDGKDDAQAEKAIDALGLPEFPEQIMAFARECSAQDISDLFIDQLKEGCTALLTALLKVGKEANSETQAYITDIVKHELARAAGLAKLALLTRKPGSRIFAQMEAEREQAGVPKDA